MTAVHPPSSHPQAFISVTPSESPRAHSPAAKPGPRLGPQRRALPSLLGSCWPLHAVCDQGGGLSAHSWNPLGRATVMGTPTASSGHAVSAMSRSPTTKPDMTTQSWGGLSQEADVSVDFKETPNLHRSSRSLKTLLFSLPETILKKNSKVS